MLAMPNARNFPFRPCPNRPNCVSTLAHTRRHAIAAWTFSLPVEDVKGEIKRAMARSPRTRLVAEEGPYLRFECRSALFGFVDDVDFFVDVDSHQVHYRSASRLGYSDFGVNRRRMMRLREWLAGRL
jgi:uncharacterized protein (DUF1499 family)